MNTPRIALTGLGRGESPQPGAGIITSIRRRWPDAFIVGLVYDCMESGIYMADGANAVYAIPYPTMGAEPLLQRLDEILAQTPFDLFIPTLDSELDLIVHIEDELAHRGIRCCLPSKEALAMRSKDNLPALAEAAGVKVPTTAPVFSVNEALTAARQMSYPMIVKGFFYDAKTVYAEDDLREAVTSLLEEWGAPALIQQRITGPEFDALGIGDGEGGMVGLCCIRKTIVSSKGKGLGGVTIHDPKLTDFCTRLIRELRWRGPFEVECMKDETSGEYVLIEINPRFPAWVDFPAQFGLNFGATLVDFIDTGEVPAPLPASQAGWFYLRHQIEVLGHMSHLAEFSATGGIPCLQSITPVS